jgi:Transglutaminase elicitor
MARGESLKEFLKKFHEDSAQMMNRLPDVVDDQGEARPQGSVDFDRVQTEWLGRIQIVSRITGMDLGTAVPDGQKDNVEKLLDPGTAIERDLSAMQEQGLTNITAAVKPWADSYWPTYRGQIAYRYADGSFPKSKNWGENFAYAESHPASLMINSGAVNLLSPAEKYDFVMGDADFTLTHFAWSRGQQGSTDGGGVATWMGICHGWSGAAHYAMDVMYPIEIEPGVNRVFDAPTKTVRYIYDLELDSNRKVIGGEWYTIAHPTFLWTFDGTAQAMAFDENLLLNDGWMGNGPVPTTWTAYAKKPPREVCRSMPS